MSSSTLWVNGLASSWLEAMGRACWQGGVALGLVWILCRLFPGVSPRAKAWLWRLAFLKLALAFVWSDSIDVPLLRARGPEDLPQIAGKAPGTRTLWPAETPATLPQPPSADGPTAPLQLSLAGWMLLAWSAGVGGQMLRVAWHWRQTRALRRFSRPADNDALLQMCGEAARQLRLRRAPEIRVSDRIAQPLLLGIVHPAVLLPIALLRDATPDRMRMILCHELAHAKRLDLFWNWLRCMDEALFYFHPMVWISGPPWRLAQELACDALAVRTAKSPLAEYAAMLLEVASSSRELPLATNSITVGILETKRDLERRIIAMKFIAQTPSKLIGLATASLLILAALGTLPWRAVAKAAPAVSQGPAGDTKPTGHAAESAKSDDAAAQDPGQATSTDAPHQARSGPKAERFLRVFVLKFGRAEEVTKHLEALNRGQGSEGQTAVVVADPRTNAVIVQAAPEEMNQIAELIRMLDVRTAEDVSASNATHDVNSPDLPVSIVLAKPAYVEKVFVAAGNTVKKGDPLVQLEDQDAKGKLLTAVAQLDIAKASLAVQEAETKGLRRENERLRALADKGTISTEDLESKSTAFEVSAARVEKARAELRLAEQQVDLAKLELSRMTIRAPRHGTVVWMRVQPGEYVAGGAGQPLMRIGGRQD